MRSLLLSAALLFSTAAVAGDDLSPDDLARLQREQKAAADDVEKKYGTGNLSPEQQKQLSKDKSAAERAVLEKNGVDAKDFARTNAKLSRSDREAVDAAGKKLDAKAAADGKAADAKKAAGGKKEIVIEKDGKSAAPVNEAAEMDKAAGLGKGKK